MIIFYQNNNVALAKDIVHIIVFLSLHNDKSFGALLTDLSREFDCVDLELFSAKLNVYRFNLPVLQLISTTYQTENNKQRVVMLILAVSQKYYLAFDKGQL